MADIKSPLKVFKPIDITDDVLYSSSIAEPDTSTGEEEWVDPLLSQNIVTNSYTLSSSSTSDEIQASEYYGGKIYSLVDKSSGNGNSYILIVDTSDNSTSTIDLGDSGFGATDSAVSSNGYICFSGEDSDAIAMVIDCSVDSVTVIDQSDVTNAGNFYRCVCYGGDGYFYLFTDADNVMRVSEGGSATVINESSVDYTWIYSCALVDGDIYAFGRQADGGVGFDLIYKLNTDSGLLTEVSTESFADYQPLAAISYGGNAYIATSRKLIAWNPTDGASYITGSAEGYDLFGYIPESVNYSSVSYATIKADGIGGLVATYSTGASFFVARVDVSTSTVTELTISDSSYEAQNVASDGAGSVYILSGKTGTSTSQANKVDYFRRPYLTSEQVVISSTHRKYQCVSDNVYESPEDGATGTDGATWVDIGATNRWAALDTEINTDSYATANYSLSGDNIGTEYIDYEFNVDEVGSVFDALSLHGLTEVDQVTVTIFESDGSTVLATLDSDLEVEVVDDADDLINTSLYADSYVFEGLSDSMNDDSIIRARFYPREGTLESFDFGVGSICFGNPRSLGVTTYDTTISIKDYSTYTYDDYGNLTTVARPPADQANFQLMIPDGGYRYTRTVLKALVAETCVWYTYDYEKVPFSILGRNTTSTITLNSPKTSSLPLKIEGVI